MYKKLKQPQQGDRTDLVDNINDPEALDLIDRVTVGRQGERTDLVDNVNDVEERPTGNTREAALRRLRKDRPRHLI